MRTGFSRLPKDTDYVIMLDGDDTYDPGEVLRMIEPLDSGFCDVVIGSRLGGKIHGDSMTLFNQMGNWIFTHLVRYVYRANVTDVLTGYFAWKKKSIDQLAPHLISDGFAIEMEMITKMARLKQDITSVPISYTQRSGESNLHPIRDGFRILFMFLRNLSWKPKTAIAIHRLE
jgi:dolichol-phosphate mannosyltransferase